MTPPRTHVRCLLSGTLGKMFRDTIEPMPSADPQRTTTAHNAAPPATIPVSQSGRTIRDRLRRAPLDLVP